MSSSVALINKSKTRKDGLYSPNKTAEKSFNAEQSFDLSQIVKQQVAARPTTATIQAKPTPVKAFTKTSDLLNKSLYSDIKEKRPVKNDRYRVVTMKAYQSNMDGRLSVPKRSSSKFESLKVSSPVLLKQKNNNKTRNSNNLFKP